MFAVFLPMDLNQKFVSAEGRTEMATVPALSHVLLFL
jgi:hypothetical protein